MTEHRVLHFLWSGGIGGPNRAIYQLVHHEMSRGEWDVAVAFGRAQGLYADAIKALGCEVLDLRMRSGADLTRALRAVSRLQQHDIHHFHAMEPVQIIASARCHDATRVFTYRHGQYMAPERLSTRMRRALGGVLLRKYIHAVSGNTEHATRCAIERYRLERLPSVVTYNGLDFSLLAPGRDRQDVRREIGAGPEDIVVGSSGKFTWLKRFDRLVALLGAGPGTRVALVGDGDLRGELEAQAEALGVTDRLHITGTVNDVTDYLQAMDVFALSSSAEESFGNSVVEAMALGIPSVVFSDSPGLCEHIENGKTGFIVRDKDEFADVVRRLGLDPQLRKRVGSAGAQYVRAKYSLENMHDAYRTLYDAALSSRGRM